MGEDDKAMYFYWLQVISEVQEFSGFFCFCCVGAVYDSYAIALCSLQMCCQKGPGG